MIGKLVVAGFVTPALIVYGGYVLWPNSHCDRVAHAAVPAYWLGSLVKLGVEPFVKDPDSLEELNKYPERLRGMMAGAIAKVFYDRDSYALLCLTDPIEAYRRAGRLDARGLIALTPEKAVPAQDKVSAIQYAMSSSPPMAAAQAAPAQPRQDGARSATSLKSQETPAQQGWFSRTWPWVAAVAVALLVFVGPLRRLVLEAVFTGKIFAFFLPPLRRLWAAHKQLLEHVLPRDVIRPSAGKRRTDLTD